MIDLLFNSVRIVILFVLNFENYKKTSLKVLYSSKDQISGACKVNKIPDSKARLNHQIINQTLHVATSLPLKDFCCEAKCYITLVHKLQHRDHVNYEFESFSFAMLDLISNSASFVITFVLNFEFSIVYANSSKKTKFQGRWVMCNIRETYCQTVFGPGSNSVGF